MTTRSNGSPHLPSKTRKVANTVLDAAVKGLEVSKDVITAAAPIPGLSIALDLLVATLKKVQATESNSRASESLATTANELINTLKELARQIEEEFGEYPAESEERRKVRDGLTSCDKLIKRVERLRSELDAICSEANKLSQRGFFTRLVFSGRDTEALNEMEKRIVEAHKRFQTEGDVTVEIIVTKTSNDIKMVIAEQQKILAAQRLSKEERVLDSIPRAEDAHFLAAANTTKARFQQGTRELVFDCLEEWEDAQFENTEQGNWPVPVCVLVGHAGTGKSIIASEFSRRLQERGRLGASFFFTRGVQDLNSPRKVFSTIFYQLARSQQLLRGPANQEKPPWRICDNCR
ncbi:hypothetical protein K466DRAFT_588532 [Polyporus arcularius HHB13444]|uniref:Nephrocystin 3-like N-terminal domain-containing protein n=1 Tax=Polyporus arcularius HHB13444 TaxID=1314778 RepID=A0A5C3P5C4_9APHY|nr:hypothetical protein K466DRAFT_588532 [Polyporus arcularius HHB13444]